MPRTVALSDFDKYVQQYMDASGLSHADVMKAIGKAGPHPTRSRGYGTHGSGSPKPGEQSAMYYENMPDIPTKKVTTPTTSPPPPPGPPPTPDPGPHVPTALERAIAAAKTGGGTYLTQALKDLGVSNTFDLADRFNAAVNAIKVPTTLPSTTADVSSYYNYKDIFSKALADVTAAQKNKASSAFRQLTPTGWEQSYIADTADDPILNEILNQQRGDVSTGLQRELQRGKISQAAYNYALNQLGNQSTAAMSTLQGLGGGVLSKDRTGLENLVNAFGTSLTNYKLGDPLDVNKLKSDLATKSAGYTGSLRGDILSALGGTQLFDPTALISKAGSVTGPSNQPGFGSNPQGTGALLTDDQRRTEGTSGVF